MDVVVVVLRQCDLLEVVATLNPPGRFARRLHGWQQERTKTAMIAITTSSSMSVKPFRLVVMALPLRLENSFNSVNWKMNRCCARTVEAGAASGTSARAKIYPFARFAQVNQQQ